jgi:hypothetical protein
MARCNALKPGTTDIFCDQELGHEDLFHSRGYGGCEESWPNLDNLNGPSLATPSNLEDPQTRMLGIIRGAAVRDHAPDPPPRLYFDGATYIPEFDETRLGIQHRAVWRVVQDEQWRILDEIIACIVANGGREYATAAISARVRDFRKPRFGSFTVDIRARGDRRNGLFEYRVRRSTATEGRISTG